MLGYPSDWALVDVETSGFRPSEHRVLSIALMAVGQDGRVAHRFSSLVNPGCDPGPVHVHGLTRERLAGSPRFEHIAPRVAAILRGRVLVAHNARFDYDFLAHEFARAGLDLPVDRRLCTLALNRRLSPPTPNMRLGTLAAHYGVVQHRAHDAADDTRVLAGVLRGSLTAASRLGLSLPLVPCPPRQDGRTPRGDGRERARYPAHVPKIACAYRNPGRLGPGGPLVQGMKVAITGDTRVPRDELTIRAATAGLNMMTSVSRHTSALVANTPASPSTKARRALAEGVPIIDEPTFLRLLEDVRPGVPHERTATRGTPAPAVPQPRRPVDGALTGRRVLVLGGPHPRAAAARARITGLGGAAAVNLSGSVTDVLVLPGGDGDRRMTRIRTLGLPVHEETWLGTMETTPPPGRTAAPGRPPILVLPRGGAVDLPVTPGTATWTVTATWTHGAPCDVDVVAFALDGDEQVSRDEDFVFYGAAENPGGTIALSADGPAEQSITVETAGLPADVRRVAIAAAVDGTIDHAVDGDATFAAIGAVEITVAPGGGEAPLAQATLDAATSERTLLLAEVYRRGPSWRLRAIGQGYDHGLDELARRYGVDVE